MQTIPGKVVVGRWRFRTAILGERLRYLRKREVFLDLNSTWRRRGSACGGRRELQLFKISFVLDSSEVADLMMSGSLLHGPRTATTYMSSA